MFAEMKEIDFLFARSSSLSRPASLDLGLLTDQSIMCIYDFINNCKTNNATPLIPCYKRVSGAFIISAVA